MDRTGVRWTVTEVSVATPALSAPRDRRDQPRSKGRKTAKSLRLATRPLGLPSLRFEARGQCRWLSPAPPDWRDRPEDELEDLLAIALDGLPGQPPNR